MSTAPQRFHAKYVKTDAGCWEWTAYRNPWGYGMFRVSHTESIRLAHRVSYELHTGPIPAGLEVDHLCKVRHCVNPAHLEAVPPAENMRRSDLPARRGWGNGRKTHCAKGHPYDDVNTYVTSRGHRQCRTCRQAVSRARRRQEVTT